MSLLLELDSASTKNLPATELNVLVGIFESVFPALQERSYNLEVLCYSLTAMEELNTKQRDKHKPTDVLSFPLFASREAWENFRQPEANLGTIVLCPEYAAAQGTPLLDLVHHGILHILGYDHETEIQVWRKIEHAILEKAQVKQLTLHGIPDTL